MPSRTWIKHYCESWLKATLRQESRQFRGDWADILALAGGLTYGEDGIVQLADGIGLSDDQIAGILNIPLNDWLTTKKRAIATDRIRVDKNNIITVINFKKYQSEYARQKPYRERAKHNAQWDAMSDEDKAIAIEAFGPVENWDEMNWIAATGTVSDEDTERINQGIIREGGKPLSF